jgi:hypothetical protein
MVKLESSVTPIPALSESTLPQLGLLAAAGAALITPACAATRAPTVPVPHVVPFADPAAMADPQARHQVLSELPHARARAQSLGMSNFVFIASNGKDYASFAKVDSLRGDTGEFGKSMVRVQHHGDLVEFRFDAFQSWKSEQAQGLRARGVNGAIFDLDGRVFNVATGQQDKTGVLPFLVLRNQK